MIARTLAAVLPTNGVIYLFFKCFALLQISLLLHQLGEGLCATITYSRENLLNIGFNCKTDITRGFQRDKDIPRDIAREAGEAWTVLPGPWSRKDKRKRQKRKRGNRAGIKIRLVRNKHRLGLPAGILMNVRSLRTKADELRLLTISDSAVSNADAIIITETWLDSNIPDEAVSLEGRIIHRADRNAESTNKSRGGGLCIYVHQKYATDSRIVHTHCCKDLEALVISCRPFYLPRELTNIIIIATYVPPSADVNRATSLLYDVITERLALHPDAGIIIAGDFNQACLKKVLPRFVQHVDCATRGDNILDKVYTQIKGAYKITALPHLATSDHVTLRLTPTYAPRSSPAPLERRNITTWPAGALDMLKDCFNSIDYNAFDNGDIHDTTDGIISFIWKVITDVTTQKSIRVFPNKKPWMTPSVAKLLRARSEAFKLMKTDGAAHQTRYKEACSELRKGIKAAKKEHKEKVEEHFQAKDARKVWRGLQAITGYKARGPSIPSNSAASLAEELNHFYARFEKSTVASTTAPAPPSPPQPANQALTLTTEQVRRALLAANPRKAAGPDCIPGKVLRACADQLAGIFSRIFNASLAQGVVPHCLKKAVIVPVPKKSSIGGLNDYRPVALTSIVMKCFERLVLQHLKSCLPENFDPMQFAYRANRSTDDAIATTLHLALNHLERPGTYARLLFIDYSSAFNTIVPSILVAKMAGLGFSMPICTWVGDFLSGRPQVVRIGQLTSQPLELSTGSPQGCVLSPFLYTLYTHDCTPIHPSNTIIKFADDTTLVGLVSGGDESCYRAEVRRLEAWCKENGLQLNASKTKEVIVDFRRKGSRDHAPLSIQGVQVERVSTVRFLGTLISEDVSWTANSAALAKRANQRLYFLRVLRRQQVQQRLLVDFYRATIESILTHGVSVWFAACTAGDRRALQRVIRTAEKVIGCPLPPIETIAASRSLERAKRILADSSHPANGLFERLPSGRRYRSLACRTNRLRDSFFPWAIRLLNSASI